MANFRPLKAYLLRLLDECIEAHGLQPPFLDVGTGRGDVAEHLARRGWQGTATDFSPSAAATAAARLAGLPVAIVRGGADAAHGRFRTALLLDVLEHEPDDLALLRTLYERLEPGGSLVLVVPTNPDEWRWDDDYYGHLRRYRPEALVRLLADAGFTVTEDWDCTFPVFWTLRRLYTALFPRRTAPGDAHTQTLASSTTSAWDGFRAVTAIAEHPLLWHLLTRIQHPFRNGSCGHERFILARRTGYATPTSE